MICPLLAASPLGASKDPDVSIDCMEKNCAWWDGCCPIKTLATLYEEIEQLNINIEYTSNAIINLKKRI